MENDVRGLIEVRMMAGKCGHHFDEDCTSCNTAKEWTDAELNRLRTALSASLAREEAMRRKEKGPRRRVVLTLEAGADSWDDLQGLFRHLETELAVHGRLSACVVSGGYSSGFVLTTNEDESITHESWAAANHAYCAALQEQANEQ